MSQSPATFRLGLDLGSTAAKAVLIDASGYILECRADTSGIPPQEAAARLSREILDRHGLACAAKVDIGYGRALAERAGCKGKEITWHAPGC